MTVFQKKTMELILIIKINVQFFPDLYLTVTQCWLSCKVIKKVVITSLVMKEMLQTNMSYLIGKHIMAFDFTELSEHT